MQSGPNGVVFDIRKFSTHDGPGIRTTVFFKGCPLNCWWCHNPESQLRQPQVMYRPARCMGCQACIAVCPQSAITPAEDNRVVTDMQRCTVCGTCLESCFTEAREIAGHTLDVNAVLADVLRDRDFYEESGGGVTFSGGEPLMQHDFLRALLQACHAEGLHTALDTSGFAPWPVLDGLRAWVNLFLYDVKLIDDARHRRYTGVSNRLILDNLRALAQHGHAIIVRLPLIPGVNDDADNLRRTAQLAAELPGIQQVDVLPYHESGLEKYRRMALDYQLADILPSSEQDVQAAVKLIESYGVRVKVGG